VNVFILNLLGAALCAVITSIALLGPEGKAILNKIDDDEERAMTGAVGIRWRPFTAALNVGLKRANARHCPRPR
jgi:hypothetical protein